MTGLSVLAVDDEVPALDELTYLLGNDERVDRVWSAHDAEEALRTLKDGVPDAVFLDVRMPGLDGVALAGVLSRFAAPPALVFVTAHEDAAVTAFELKALDYVLKPVSPARLRQAVDRVLDGQTPASVDSGESGDPGEVGEVGGERIPVELAGVTRFIPRSSVLWVEANGDYARLHTAKGEHLIRVPLAVLETRWRSAGFIRVHRSHLVALAHVRQLRLDPSGHYSVVVGSSTLPIARRHSRELRDLLVRRARP